MPANLRIKYLPVDELVPYARNARTHSEAQVAQIAASIEEFGWTNPVLTDAEGGIIAGHGRVLAAVLLGMTKVPCIELGHLTEVQRRAYVIADNKLALNAGWDEHLLTAEFLDLEALDFDLALTGFDPDEIAALVAAQAATEGLTDPDATPKRPPSGPSPHPA
ncbi:MAG: ParB N-terminal domain-containing protein, partial [Proteobacteria bacterium]|nr:ParB N-terminal domain-containing protein [Pseudomonadota bacterium]